MHAPFRHIHTRSLPQSLPPLLLHEAVDAVPTLPESGRQASPVHEPSCKGRDDDRAILEDGVDPRAERVDLLLEGLDLLKGCSQSQVAALVDHGVADWQRECGPSALAASRTDSASWVPALCESGHDITHLLNHVLLVNGVRVDGVLVVRHCQRARLWRGGVSKV